MTLYEWFLFVSCLVSTPEVVIVFTTLLAVVPLLLYLFPREWVFSSVKNGAVFTVVVSTVITLFVSPYYCEPLLVENALVQGSTLQWDDIECQIERQDTQIHKLLDDKPGGYSLVMGPHGTGKSTLLKNLTGPRVVYVTAGDDLHDFGIHLANALSVNLNCDIFPAPGSNLITQIASTLNMKWWNTSECPDTLLTRVRMTLGILTEAVNKMYLERAKTVTLIVDHIDDINVDIVDILQDFAKSMEDKPLNFIFSANDGKVPRHFMGRSSASRLTRQRYVGEISDKEALDYLQCKCPKVEKGALTEVVNLVGGCFAYLNVAHQDLCGNGLPLDSVKETLFQYVEDELNTVGVDPFFERNNTITNAMKSVGLAILKSEEGRIDERDYYRLMREQNKTLDDTLKLLESDILTEKCYLGSVKFQSTLVRTYFLEMLIEQGYL